MIHIIYMDEIETKKTTVDIKDDIIRELFSVGAHYGHVKSRRHPSIRSFIFGAKNKIEIFDLEKTKEELAKAKDFIKEVGIKGGTILFVGGKNEAHVAIQTNAEALSMPYVAGRWIGGTLTNFEQIKKRTGLLQSLESQKEKGELGKYTKREQLMIDRDITKLTETFGGIVEMKNLPDVLFVVDAQYEDIAVNEANTLGIPVVALCSSDCDITKVKCAIPGNDSSRKSIAYIIDSLVEAYKEGKKSQPAPLSTDTQKEAVTKVIKAE